MKTNENGLKMKWIRFQKEEKVSMASLLFVALFLKPLSETAFDINRFFLRSIVEVPQEKKWGQRKEVSTMIYEYETYEENYEEVVDDTTVNSLIANMYTKMSTNAVAAGGIIAPKVED